MSDLTYISKQTLAEMNARLVAELAECRRQRRRNNMNGIERIAAERQRQVEQEGWTPEHDQAHEDGVLAAAGLGYLTWATGQLQGYSSDSPPFDWPWDESWWKPSDDPIRNLVKAGALIAAEIDRLASA